MILGVVGVVAVAAAVLAVWPRYTVLEPYVRFVDTHFERGFTGQIASPSPLFAGPTAFIPVARLLNDTRYVLKDIEQATLTFAEKIDVPADGMLSFYPEVPPSLRDATRLALIPQLEIGTEWRQLPTFEVTTHVEDNVPRVRVRLAATGAAPGDKVGINIDAFAIPRESATEYRTVPVRIPAGASLAFAFGIPRPAWRQGRVFFEIRACADEVCEPIFQEVLDPSEVAGHGWHDRRVSLQPFAGSERTLLFTTRLTNPDPQAFSFPLWANPTIVAPRRRRQRPLNIILLSIDTLSAKHLPTYGAVNDTAPFVNETFGKSGTVFEHCVAAAVTTPPSHMTMLTGVQPCVHSLTTGLEGIPLWLVSLAGTLRGAGYETGAVTEDGWLGAIHGFARGFSSYAENASPDIMEPRGQVDVTFAKAKAWLSQHYDKPFFLFLHTFQVHDPYAPPPEYAQLFGVRDGEPVTASSPRVVQDVTNYEREIRYTDDEVRKLFDALHEYGLERNTIFILTSDHGEEFFEHGAWGHGTDLYEETTRVPLMLWGPGRIPAGRRVAQPVGHIDFMPTILELAGVPIPAQVMGTSFLGLIDGSAQPRAAQPYFTEAWGGVRVLPDYTLIPFDRPAYMAQIGMQKLSRYRADNAFGYQFYDLGVDPEERTDRYAATSDAIAGLQARLDKYEDDCRAAVARLSAGPREVDKPTPGSVKLSPAEEEKLRALGYLK